MKKAFKLMKLVKLHETWMTGWWVWHLSISCEGNGFRWTPRTRALWDEADRVHLVKGQNASCFCCVSCFISNTSYWGSSPSPVYEQASSTGKPLLMDTTWHGSLTYSEKSTGCLTNYFVHNDVKASHCPLNHLSNSRFYIIYSQFILSREMRHS